MISPEATERAREYFDRTADFDYEDILYRYRSEKSGSEVPAEDVLREMRRWLALNAANPGAGYVMLGGVDDMWHTFVLFTDQYQRFCEEHFGRFVHHVPNVPRSEDDEPRVEVQPDGSRHIQFAPDVVAGYRRFVDDYRTVFPDIDLSSDLWPRILDDGKVTCPTDSCCLSAACYIRGCGPDGPT